MKFAASNFTHLLVDDPSVFRTAGEFFAALLAAVIGADAMCRLRAVELGTLRGEFAESFLGAVNHKFTNRREQNEEIFKGSYHAVDMWSADESFVDAASATDEVHHGRLLYTARRLRPFWPSVHLIQQDTITAARLFDDRSLDFIFLDARHDYCAVWDDLVSYWPKLKPGGLFAGHDYLTHDEALNQLGVMYEGYNDWRLCANGTIHHGGVKEAVNRFAASLGLPVGHMFHLQFGHSPYWMIHQT